MMVNSQDEVEILWRDTGTGSNVSHPLNAWVNATQGGIGNVYPTTSLGYTTYFYAQMADRTIQAYNMSWAAENTTMLDGETFSLTHDGEPVKAQGGSRLTVSAYSDYNEGETTWDSLFVFYQADGDDVTILTRPFAGGDWSREMLEIPPE